MMESLDCQEMSLPVSVRQQTTLSHTYVYFTQVQLTQIHIRIGAQRDEDKIMLPLSQSH